MKSLVIYDSNFGNTKQIAEVIAETLGGRAVSVNDVKENDLVGIDLLVVGSPINAWRATPKVQAFLSNLKNSQLKRVSAAAFDTRIKIFFSGNAAKRIARSLTEAGAELITPPLAFYVKEKEGPLVHGEIAKAKSWARHLWTVNKNHAIKRAI